MNMQALCRSDQNYWQAIAGGGNENESPAAAAIRESKEEAGLASSALYYRLQSCSSIPTCFFEDRKYWPNEIYVIPEYAFAVDCTEIEIVLSIEHSEIIWGSYDDTHKRFHWDSNKVALWEINERLKTHDLSDPLVT